jgi:hypothetical protein
MGFLARACPLFVAALSAAVLSIGVHTTDAATGGVPLSLQAACNAASEAPSVRVQITNQSDQATAVVLGFTADDGSTHVVNAVQVIAIRQITGADEAYVYVNPQHALSTPGPPWIISLAPGATHDLELPLRDFISTLNYSHLEPDVAGGSRLVLEARPAASWTPPPWTGTVETVIEPCRY